MRWSKVFFFGLMLFLVVSLPLSVSLVLQVQDERSSAAESSSKVSFKFAFKGVGSSAVCLSDLGNLKVEVVNVPSNIYQSGISASFKKVAGEVDKYGDQVFEVDNLSLDSKFTSVNNFNYLKIKGSFHSAAKLCVNNQTVKVADGSSCSIALGGSTVYDFSDYPLVPGDVNQDGIINGQDYSTVKNSIGSVEGVVCGQDGDLNLDGVVNSLDTALIKEALSSKEEGVVIKSTESSSTTVAQASSVKELKIAVISDIHDRTEYLSTMLKRVKQDGVSLVVIAGDLTWKGEKAELEDVKAVVNTSGVEVIVIPGNHDSWDKYFESVFGKSYQSKQYGKIKLIMIDDSQETAGLGDTQKQWITTELADCNQLVCVAIMHEPVVNPNSAHIMGEYNANVAVDAKWLKNILINSGVRATISGHIHEVQAYDWNGITTYLVGPARENIFSEFVISDSGKISRAVIK